MITSFLLILSILAGQLIKFPLFGTAGPTLLDFFVFSFSILGLIKLKFRLKMPPAFLKFGFLFSAVCILSLIFTPLNLNIVEYLSSFSYIVRFFLYLLFGLIIYSGAFEDFKKRIQKFLLFSGVGLAVLGLLQFLLLPNLQFLETFGWDPHFFRTVSTFLDPNFAGAYFVLTLLLLTSLRGTKQSILLLSFFFIITYLALLTTFSRSSYLMFLISGIYFSFLKKSKILFLSTLLLFLFLLSVFYSYNKSIANPRGINREQSAGYRITTWQQGLSLFQQSPILGIGFNAYRYGIREYSLSDTQFLESRGSTSNDSSLLYVLATTGIVGFGVYIAFLFHLQRVAVLGLLIHSIFANSLFYPPIFLWIILLGVKKESI